MSMYPDQLVVDQCLSFGRQTNAVLLQQLAIVGALQHGACDINDMHTLLCSYTEQRQIIQRVDIAEPLRTAA